MSSKKLSLSFQSVYKKELSKINQHLQKTLFSLIQREKIKSAKDQNLIPLPKEMKKLHSAMKYSLFPGGKRFRSLLPVLLAKALKKPIRIVLPFSSALEMIHTYSLIHDDLPCMDHEMERRGKKTNHRVFGEALALLSGNTLLTEAFSLLMKSYKKNPLLNLNLMQILLEAIGFSGMLGGQAIDIEKQNQQKKLLIKNESLNKKLKILKDLHKRKTGSLIEGAILGASLLLEVKPPLEKNLKNLGLYLGLAFQIADDVCDSLKKNQETQKIKAKKPFPVINPKQKKHPSPASIVSFSDSIGLKQSQEILNELTQMALACIPGKEFYSLRELVKWNQKRRI